MTEHPIFESNMYVYRGLGAIRKGALGVVRELLLVTFAYIVSIVSGVPSSPAALRHLQPLDNAFVRLSSPLLGGLGLIPRLMLFGGKAFTSLRAVLSSLSLTQYVDS
jgi:hypothetical protein